jgi:hypothetical protein
MSIWLNLNLTKLKITISNIDIIDIIFFLIKKFVMKKLFLNNKKDKDKIVKSQSPIKTWNARVNMDVIIAKLKLFLAIKPNIKIVIAWLSIPFVCSEAINTG